MIYQSTLTGQGSCARIVYRSVLGHLQELTDLGTSTGTSTSTGTGTGTDFTVSDLTHLAAAPLFGERLAFTVAPTATPAPASRDTD